MSIKANTVTLTLQSVETDENSILVGLGIEAPDGIEGYAEALENKVFNVVQDTSDSLVDDLFLLLETGVLTPKDVAFLLAQQVRALFGRAAKRSLSIAGLPGGLRK